MFIIWGRKTVYRKLGYVADFCPMCREISIAQLQRVGSVGHVYYLSFGQGELVGYERKCLSCKTAAAADPHAYAAVAKTLAPLPDIIAQTFPDIEAVLKERLALEAKIKNAPMSLTPEERAAVIRVPFLELSPKVEKRFATTHIDKEVGFSLIVASFLLIGSEYARSAFAPDLNRENVMFAVGGLGLLLVIWQGAFSGRRFMRRQVIPLLSDSLRPLQPSETELKAVLAELKQFGHKIGRKMPLNDLLSRVSQGNTVQ